MARILKVIRIIRFPIEDTWNCNKFNAFGYNFNKKYQGDRYKGIIWYSLDATESSLQKLIWAVRPANYEDLSK